MHFQGVLLKIFDGKNRGMGGKELRENEGKELFRRENIIPSDKIFGERGLEMENLGQNSEKSENFRLK